MIAFELSDAVDSQKTVYKVVDISAGISTER